ncbi:MAG: amidohydrolase family protein [Xanthomonadales bacterium]|nr:amidohydrolase family protein [Xanthomonadales bacterium]
MTTPPPSLIKTLKPWRLVQNSFQFSFGFSSIDSFKLIVKFGMQPIEAIQTATINAADLMGIKDRGRIEKGLLADIIGVPGNPPKGYKSDGKCRLCYERWNCL